jgi:radical SAM protein with 4Fe4S-binding SPASM domain
MPQIVLMWRTSHIARLGWSFKISKAVRLPYPPYQYTIEPTHACNLRCSFCPQSDPQHSSRRPVGRLSADGLRIFLQRRREASPGNKNLNFTLDGEPFMNRDFLKLVQLASSEGLFVIFASNGILINPRTADKLIAAGPFRASIDFAPDRKLFETLRGRPGDHATVYENLGHLINQAMQHRTVYLDIHDITPFTRSDPESSLRQLRAMFPSNAPKRVRFLSRQFHNFCGHLTGELHKEGYRVCPYPWTQMAVTWSGDCVGCCRDTVGGSVLGNVFEDSIMDVWNGERYRQFRENLLNRKPELNEACRNCDMPYSGGERRWRLGYQLRSLIGR